MNNTYHHVFFHPRVGIHYTDGFVAGKMKSPLRILVLGAHHICDLPCPHTQQCMQNSRPFDHLCPSYKDRDNQDYYCLSNSNVLEIDGFVESNLYAAYPSYSAFTKFMLHKRDYVSPSDSESFWDQVAFYNYMQDFRPRAISLPTTLGPTSTTAICLPSLKSSTVSAHSSS